MTTRPGMEIGDWLNAMVSLVIGVLLGIAADGLLQLVSSGLWLLALMIPLFFAALFGCMLLLERGLDRLIPTGIRPASKPTRRRHPLPRLLSLPIGALLGLMLARLELAQPLLDLLP